MLPLLTTATFLILPIASQLVCDEKWEASKTKKDIKDHPAFQETNEFKDENQVKNAIKKVQDEYDSLCKKEIGEWDKNDKIKPRKNLIEYLNYDGYLDELYGFYTTYQRNEFPTDWLNDDLKDVLTTLKDAYKQTLKSDPVQQKKQGSKEKASPVNDAKISERKYLDRYYDEAFDKKVLEVLTTNKYFLNYALADIGANRVFTKVRIQQIEKKKGKKAKYITENVQEFFNKHLWKKLWKSLSDMVEKKVGSWTFKRVSDWFDNDAMNRAVNEKIEFGHLFMAGWKEHDGTDDVKEHINKALEFMSQQTPFPDSAKVSTWKWRYQIVYRTFVGTSADNIATMRKTVCVYLLSIKFDKRVIILFKVYDGITEMVKKWMTSGGGKDAVKELKQTLDTANAWNFATPQSQFNKKKDDKKVVVDDQNAGTGDGKISGIDNYAMMDYDDNYGDAARLGVHNKVYTNDNMWYGDNVVKETPYYNDHGYYQYDYMTVMVSMLLVGLCIFCGGIGCFIVGGLTSYFIGKSAASRNKRRDEQYSEMETTDV